jgi:hypothetical protein
MMLYANDNTDYLPYPNWGGVPGQIGWMYAPTLNPLTQTGAAMPDMTGRADDMSFPSTNQIPWFKVSQLGNILANPKVCICPKDASLSGGSERSLFQGRGQRLTSYCWNGAVCSYGGIAKTHKTTEFGAQAILMWETDERTPYNFNDASSYPSEGFSLRHAGGNFTLSTDATTVKGGATVGLFSGSTMNMTYKAYYQLAGANGYPKPAVLPNELYCDPGNPLTGGY